jgi:hypothetical protein
MLHPVVWYKFTDISGVMIVSIIALEAGIVSETFVDFY